MLDADTKRRIDTCRDILVGKVPDPKSQVEQITIALIYKFMDDMDAEAEELGGTRSFFAGNYVKYGWAKLMAPSMGGFDVLALYSEAIGKMNENPGIPPLFREIFKNAYLPYRDPETLRIFLKEIDGFTYDHSERLGDAFEYLLSVLGSQGDAGQFRTPRHIIDFMVEVIDPKKNESVLDPACGTAGFLISAWKYIISQNTKNRPGDQLTPEERANLAANIHGYDISPDMVRLSLVNMYLHGFTDPHIIEYDTLASEERWNETADIVLANPPFMSPKGGIKPHKRFSVQAKRSEVLFVDYMAEHLNSQGRAAIIVPEGIVERTDVAYRQLRELLLREHLIGVISLPAGVFLPYTKVKTSILVFDRQMARKGLPILFSQVRHVGISLDSARAEVLENDLPQIIEDYRAMSGGRSVSPLSWLVDRQKLLTSPYQLVGSQFKPRTGRSRYPFVRLGDICHIEKGQSSSTKTPPGAYPLVVRGEENLTSATYQYEGEAVCVPILSLAHGKGQIKRIHYIRGKFAVADLLAVLQPKDPEALNAKYLLLALDRVKDDLAAKMQGAVHVTLKLPDLRKYEIPLPPPQVQRALALQYEELKKLIEQTDGLISKRRAEIDKAVDDVFEGNPKKQLEE